MAVGKVSGSTPDENKEKEILRKKHTSKDIKLMQVQMSDVLNFIKLFNTEWLPELKKLYAFFR